MAVTISSSSTDAEVKAAYDDNAAYDINASTDQAATFIVACRILLRRLPRAASQGENGSIDLDLRNVREELQRAVRWYTAKIGTGGGVRFSDFRSFRE